MRVHTKRLGIEKDVAVIKDQHKTIGFVPTMGALHRGHLRLVKKAIDQNDVVIVSIFVNPTQFNNSEDLTNYPRNLDADITFLADLSPEIIIFAPSAEEIYGKKIISIHYDFKGLEYEMEGKFRSGHFDGVATILKHLFSVVSPTSAYFGEKDFQQLQIVKKLVAIEKMAVKIIGCPIYREESGLALSSRNKRLRTDEMEAAPMIYKILVQVKHDFGTKSVLKINEWVSEQFKHNEILTLEYFEIAKISTLKPVKRKHKNSKYRAFIAVFAGDVRLIDNIALN